MPCAAFAASLRHGPIWSSQPDFSFLIPSRLDLIARLNASQIDFAIQDGRDAMLPRESDADLRKVRRSVAASGRSLRYNEAEAAE